LIVVGVGLLVIAGGVVVTDASMLLYDASTALSSTRPSIGYAKAELSMALPQLALGIWGTSKLDSGTAVYAGIYTFGMGIMAAHAIWALATAPSEPPTPESAPVPEPGATPDLSPAFSIGPTWVPVGQLARPGFGLVGRF
jgi:hypothetical protein